MTDPNQRLRELRAGRVPDIDLYGLIHEFGEMGFHESETDVAQYLQHTNPKLRYIALNVLTFHWDKREYRGECERIMVEDPEPEVRAMAAAGLGFVLRKSRDPEATRSLLIKLRDHSEQGIVRKSAYDALLDLWADRSRQARNAKKELEAEEESIQMSNRVIELSAQLDDAKAGGDEARAQDLSRIVEEVVEANEKQWERLVDWGFIDAIERGQFVE